MLAWSGWRDCTGFLFPGSVVVGAVRLKWWGGGLAFFHFLYFAVGSPGVRLSVVGFCSFILILCLVNFDTFRGRIYKLLILSYLLQVV